MAGLIANCCKFTAASVNQEVEELTVDGRKVRLRIPEGERCEWRDYKAINLDGQAVAAYFQDNQAWHALGKSATTVRNSHRYWGWTKRADANLIAGIATSTQRLEILDWYHLGENLGFVAADFARE